MCPSRNVLNQTKNGLFTYCEHSKLFQFVFNNLCFELYEWELEKFVDYIKSPDIPYWEYQLEHSPHQRKIPISVGHQHLIVLVNRRELEELKHLLTGNNPIKLLKLHEIDYSLIDN